MVDAIDISAQRIASPSDVSAVITRSRIGLPYFVSPICRYGAFGEALMQLPWGYTR